MIPPGKQPKQTEKMMGQLIEAQHTIVAKWRAATGFPTIED